MEKLFNGVSILIGLFGGAAAWTFGAWDVALIALITVMVLDYVTGVLKAVYTKSLSSKIGVKGLIKKVMILAVVALANVADQVTGSSAAMVREVVIFFFIANEGISILENAAVMLPVPMKLKNLLLQLRGEDDENRD